jgi:hypothetical protein
MTAACGRRVAGGGVRATKPKAGCARPGRGKAPPPHSSLPGLIFLVVGREWRRARDASALKGLSMTAACGRRVARAGAPAPQNQRRAAPALDGAKPRPHTGTKHRGRPEPEPRCSPEAIARCSWFRAIECSPTADALPCLQGCQTYLAGQKRLRPPGQHVQHNGRRPQDHAPHLLPASTACGRPAH